MDDKLQKLLDKFTPYKIKCDLDSLDVDIKEALPHIVNAMRGMDTLFRKQVGPQVVEIFEKLERDGDTSSPLYQCVQHFNGPYDKLSDGAPFVDGVTAAPPQKAVYPADITEKEFDDYIASHPEKKSEFISPFTVITREGGELKAIPYHEYYRAELEPVADELRKASEIVKHGGLKEFLKNRAAALLGEYPLSKSDGDWVKLIDSPLEVVIGPFEVYEDGLKGLKAFYEGMFLKVDFEACASLKKIEGHLSELAASIPTPDGSRPSVGGIAPMVVAEEIIATGEGYAGILASAFNLPNDPEVRGEIGWKQVMIKNVMQAKFESCTAKIGARMLSEKQVADQSFDAYFYTVLLHEVSHGLGPAYRADGRSTNEACGKYYTPIEEAKADTGALVLLIEKNGTCGIPSFELKNIGASYLAGLYRSARFGLHEAHGKANVIQYSWFKRKGVLVEEEGTGKLLVKAELMYEAARELLDKLTSLQASGAEDELKSFLDDFGTPPDELVKAIDSLADLPIDIKPEYSV